MTNATDVISAALTQNAFMHKIENEILNIPKRDLFSAIILAGIVSKKNSSREDAVSEAIAYTDELIEQLK